MRVLSKIVIGLTSLALLTGALGCAPKGPTRVTVMLDWAPNTNHTGLYVAQALGLYAKQGLQVDIVQPGQSTTAVSTVASGKADFGISFQEEVTDARATDVPVVSIAAVVQHNTSALMSLASKNITRPKDLEGKKYGSFGLPIERQELDVLMKCDGGDVNKVQFVDIGASDPLMAIQRDVDVVWIYEGWEGAEAQLQDLPVNLVRFSDWTQCLPDYYSPVIITNEQTIAQRPDIVRRFMAATSQGYTYAAQHPTEAADILIKAAPEANADLIRRSQAWLSPRYQADAPRWGEQSAQVWANYAAWMSDRGLLPKKIDTSKAFTNDFLPKQ